MTLAKLSELPEGRITEATLRPTSHKSKAGYIYCTKHISKSKAGYIYCTKHILGGFGLNYLRAWFYILETCFWCFHVNVLKGAFTGGEAMKENLCGNWLGFVYNTL